jgi:hypothetical protein
MTTTLKIQNVLMKGTREALRSGPGLVMTHDGESGGNLTQQQKEHDGGNEFHDNPANISLVCCVKLFRREVE